MFLANYADVLTDMPLDDMIDRFSAQPDKVGALLAVPPQSAFHCVDVGDDDTIHSISTLQQMPMWENGGYFVLRPEIFDYIPENGDLVADGAMVLAKEGRMMAYPLPGVLAARRHGQGAHRAGGRLPERHPAVDALGPERAERTPLQATIAAMHNNQHER